MHISFSPLRSEERLEASCSGDVLILNGTVFNFAPLPDGATLPRAAVQSEWLGSDVERIKGEIHLTLILPHGAAAPQHTLFPESVAISDGPIPLPPYEETPDAD